MPRREPKRFRSGWRQDRWRQDRLAAKSLGGKTAGEKTAQHSGVVVSSGKRIPLLPKLLYPPNLKFRPKRPMLSLWT